MSFFILHWVRLTIFLARKLDFVFQKPQIQRSQNIWGEIFVAKGSMSGDDFAGLQGLGKGVKGRGFCAICLDSL